MSENQDNFDTKSRNLNEELTIVAQTKTKHETKLAEVVGEINADTEEQNEKDEQKRDLTHEYDTTTARQHQKITEILFTKICAVRKVRNELLITSRVSPPSGFSDC